MKNSVARRSVITLAVSALLLTTLFVFQNCSDSNPNPSFQIVTLSSADSTTLYTAMSDAGVTNSSSQAGTTTLASSLINCNSADTPGATVTCTISESGGILTMNSSDASAVQTVLLNNGCLENNGLAGEINAEALNVSCSESTAPGSTPSCQIQLP